MRRFRHLFRAFGAGVISGASNDDPSAIGTYASVGAQFGFTSLWTALYSLPLVIVAQFMCARIAMISGVGLGASLKRHYPRPLLWSVVGMVFVANTLNAGADIAAIASGIRLFLPIPYALLVIPITLLILLVQIFGSYKLIMRVFKWLVLALFAYVIAGFSVPFDDLGAVLRNTLIPAFSADSGFMLAIVAILGTRLSPYLFVWQASQSVEEETQRGRITIRQRKGATDEELNVTALDINIGMIFSNLIMYFIILVTAATLNANGISNVTSATDAAEALRPLAGDAARILFAAGFIGAGLLAIPVLTSGAAYTVTDAFGWRNGLNRKPRQAPQFYALIVVSSLIGMAINFFGFNAIDLLVFAAALNGVLSPILLLIILHMSNNRVIVGNKPNSRLLNVVGILAVVVMSAAAIALFIL